MVVLTVVSAGTANHGRRVECYWPLVEYWREWADAKRWICLPVEGRDPVDSKEPVYYCDLADSDDRSRSRVTHALLPVSTWTGEVDWLTEAENDLLEGQEVRIDVAFHL